MEPQTCKLPRKEKLALIWRYLRGVVLFFILSVFCACLSMVFHALTPQIIKITVDSILGTEEASLGFLQKFIAGTSAQELSQTIRCEADFRIGMFCIASYQTNVFAIVIIGVGAK